MRHLTLVHLAFALVLVVGLMGAYGVWYSMVEAESAKATQLATDIETKSRDSARVAAAKAALALLSEDEASVQQYLVPPEDVVPFLEALEKTGRDLGATVEVVSVSAEKDTAHPHLSLSLKLSGPFDSVLRTLGAIEYGPYDSALKNLTLDTPRRAEGEEGASAWVASASFTIGTQSTQASQAPALPGPEVFPGF